MQQRYLVTWEIDIYADSPWEAAEEAWNHMREPGSSANVFSSLTRTGRRPLVDLEEQQ